MMHTAEAVRLVYRASMTPKALGVGKTKFYEIVNSDSTFPKEIELGPRARAYLVAEIDEWLESRKVSRQR